MLTGFFPFSLEESMVGVLRNRAITLPAETLAFEASGANEVARPMDIAVNTIAANTLCVCVCVCVLIVCV